MDDYHNYTSNYYAGVSHDAAVYWATAEGVAYYATGQRASYPAAGMYHYYDSDGLRVKKTDTEITTYYLRSSVLGVQVICEISASGAWNRLRLHRFADASHVVQFIGALGTSRPCG